MKLYKFVYTVFMMLCASFNFSFAQVNSKQDRSGGGGNGQLVVIPRGHTKPVPYESVRAWEIGKYDNFDRLPGINGNREIREKFDRNYAIYAKEWMEFIRLNKRLYSDVKKASEITPFRFVNDYIAWQNPQTPEGSIDYKKYEKAALYKGEVILSLPVIDSIGPLNGVITKEQNQGFILIKELLHAAYPHFDEEAIVKIGESLIRARFMGDSKEDLLYHLSSAHSYFLQYQGYKDEFLNVAKELLKYEKNGNMHAKLAGIIDTAGKYVFDEKNPDISSLQSTLLSEVNARSIKSVEGLNTYLRSIYERLNAIGFNRIDEILDLSFLKKLANIWNVSLLSLRELKDPFSGKNFALEIDNVVQEVFRKKLVDYINKGFSKDITKLKDSDLVGWLWDIIESDEIGSVFGVLFGWMIPALSDEENLGLKDLAGEARNQIVRSLDAKSIELLKSEILREAKRRDMDVDLEKSREYLRWYKLLSDPLRGRDFPFESSDEGRRLLRLESGVFSVATIVSVSVRAETIRLKYALAGHERIYGREENSDRVFKKTIYGVSGNLERLIILKK